MSLAGIVRLIDRLRADFGPAFIITLAPVAAALVEGGGNLSGFGYGDLERVRGGEVAWYNAQFYCGWGDVGVPGVWEVVSGGGTGRWGRGRVVVGLVTRWVAELDLLTPFTVGGVKERGGRVLTCFVVVRTISSYCRPLRAAAAPKTEEYTP